jgi:uncharacterized protein (TIGR03086 family)
MNEPEVFISAEKALTNVVNQIKDDQWAMRMPPEFARRDKKEVTLREIIGYHAYDDAWVPDTLASKTIAEVGTKYDGDLLGNDPKAAWQGIVDKAVAAVTDDYDPERTVHLTYGDWPAKEYLRHIISFRALRAVDIARVIGVDDKLPSDLLPGLWDLLSPDAEEWRKMGVYGPKIDVSDDASLQDRLLGLTGRQPTAKP